MTYKSMGSNDWVRVLGWIKEEVTDPAISSFPRGLHVIRARCFLRGKESGVAREEDYL